MRSKMQEIEPLHMIITHNKNVDHSNLWTAAEKYRRGNLFGYSKRKAALIWFIYSRIPCVYGDMTTKSGDDSLYLTYEDGNKHNKPAVAVIIGGSTVGNVPKTLSKTVSLFLALPNFAINCKVTGKRINRGAEYGLKVSV